MGVVYYSNYLIWFEIARTEFFRKRGVDYREVEEKHKRYLPVVESYCRYKAPIKYDDLVNVTAVLTEVNNSSLTFEYEVKVNGRVTTTGRTKHVFIDENRKPVPVPPEVKAAFQ